MIFPRGISVLARSPRGAYGAAYGQLALRSRSWLRKHHTHGHAHSHGHQHVHSGELLRSGNVKDPAVRITLVGLAANAGMVVMKGAGGVLFHSQSLIADAIHALTDLCADFMTLATVSAAKRPPSLQFPNGYGRIETAGALGVGAMLLFAGFSMGCSSLSEVLTAFDVSVPFLASAHAHAHSHAVAPEWSAALVALASIAVKETLFQATRRVARKQHSQVLYANAWHHRVDSLVSVVAIVSICAARLLGMGWIDPLGGLLVSAAIVRAGWEPTASACVELCGGAQADPADLHEAEIRAQQVLAEIAPTYVLENVTLLKYGSTYVCEVRVSGIGAGAEAVAEQLRARLTTDRIKRVYVVI